MFLKYTRNIILYYNINCCVFLTGFSEEAKQKSLGSFSHPGLWSPLKLMLIYIFFSNIMSGVPYAPYLMNIFASFNTQVEPAWAMVIQKWH